MIAIKYLLACIAATVFFAVFICLAGGRPRTKPRIPPEPKP